MLFGVEYSLKTENKYNYFLLVAKAQTWEGEKTGNVGYNTRNQAVLQTARISLQKVILIFICILNVNHKTNPVAGGSERSIGENMRHKDYFTCHPCRNCQIHKAVQYCVMSNYTIMLCRETDKGRQIGRNARTNGCDEQYKHSPLAECDKGLK